MATVAAGANTAVYCVLDGTMTITPGSGGRVSINGRGRDGSQAVAPRELYGALTLSVAAGDTILIEAIGADATYTDPNLAVQALVSEYETAGSPSPSFATNVTWATLPAASAYIGMAYISDVGARGSLWRSDGANWGIVGGSVVLDRGHVDLTVTAASTSEVDLVTLTIPAGLMGANGLLEVVQFWEATNNANVKTMRVKLGGTAFFANATSINSNGIFLPPPTRIWNRNSEASQVAFAAANGNTSVSTGTAKTTGTVDTSAATSLVISGQKATGSDTLTLMAYSVRLIRP